MNKTAQSVYHCVGSRLSRTIVRTYMCGFLCGIVPLKGQQSIAQKSEVSQRG